MHLLVRGAFCLYPFRPYLGEPYAVLMHLLVLGAFCRDLSLYQALKSDSLNAPSGAGCFLPREDLLLRRLLHVLMHLVVLGAF